MKGGYHARAWGRGGGFRSRCPKQRAKSRLHAIKPRTLDMKPSRRSNFRQRPERPTTPFKIPYPHKLLKTTNSTFHNTLCSLGGVTLKVIGPGFMPLIHAEVCLSLAIVSLWPGMCSMSLPAKSTCFAHPTWLFTLQSCRGRGKR